MSHAALKYVMVMCFGLLLLLVNVSLATENKAEMVAMRIYFTPFAAVHAVPITMATIEKSNLITLWFVKRPQVLGEHPFIAKLRKTLTGTKGTEDIDDLLVRLRVDFSDATIFVDQKGTVLAKNTGEKFKLSDHQTHEIEQDIEYFAGIVDARASLKVSKKKTMVEGTRKSKK